MGCFAIRPVSDGQPAGVSFEVAGEITLLRRSFWRISSPATIALTRSCGVALDARPISVTNQKKCAKRVSKANFFRLRYTEGVGSVASPIEHGRAEYGGPNRNRGPEASDHLPVLLGGYCILRRPRPLLQVNWKHVRVDRMDTMTRPLARSRMSLARDSAPSAYRSRRSFRSRRHRIASLSQTDYIDYALASGQRRHKNTKNSPLPAPEFGSTCHGSDASFQNARVTAFLLFLLDSRGRPCSPYLRAATRANDRTDRCRRVPAPRSCMHLLASRSATDRRVHIACMAGGRDGCRETYVERAQQKGGAR